METIILNNNNVSDLNLKTYIDILKKLALFQYLVVDFDFLENQKIERRFNG